jgi:hypothetical protein
MLKKSSEWQTHAILRVSWIKKNMAHISFI